MEQLGVPFEIKPSNYEEDMTLPLPPDKLAEKLGLGKATDVAKDYPNDIVIGCDTLIAHNGKVLGKPKSEEEARETLRELSGTTHELYTGLAVLSPGREFVTHVQNEINFREYKDDEIDWYISTGEPMDKAGSYAIQERGARFVKRINGDPSAIIGIPLSVLTVELQNLGVL